MKTAFRPHLQCGDSPLLISVPHAGVRVPEDLSQRFTASACKLPDTDWHVDRLYGWARGCGSGMLVAPMSRYVIDLNRPPDDAPLYDASVTRLNTGLVPVTTFSGAPVYLSGREPGSQEIRTRRDAYWSPYHQCLQDELSRIRREHGHAVLLDAHSIRSRVPLLFDGTLPDLNLGSDDGRSAADSLLGLAGSVLADREFSLVTDGRFKGGFITRYYGSPRTGIHALQLEMAQSAYMNEEPPKWSSARARPMQTVLKRLVHALMNWQPDG